MPAGLPANYTEMGTLMPGTEHLGMGFGDVIDPWAQQDAGTITAEDIAEIAAEEGIDLKEAVAIADQDPEIPTAPQEPMPADVGEAEMTPGEKPTPTVGAEAATDADVQAPNMDHKVVGEEPISPSAVGGGPETESFQVTLKNMMEKLMSDEGEVRGGRPRVLRDKALAGSRPIQTIWAASEATDPSMIAADASGKCRSLLGAT